MTFPKLAPKTSVDWHHRVCLLIHIFSLASFIVMNIAGTSVSGSSHRSIVQKVVAHHIVGEPISIIKVNPGSCFIIILRAGGSRSGLGREAFI